MYLHLLSVQNILNFKYLNYSCVINGFGIASIPSTGHMSTTLVPLHTTKPKGLVSSTSLYGSSGSRKYSVVLSNTRLSNGS